MFKNKCKSNTMQRRKSLELAITATLTQSTRDIKSTIFTVLVLIASSLCFGLAWFLLPFGDLFWREVHRGTWIFFDACDIPSNGADLKLVSSSVDECEVGSLWEASFISRKIFVCQNGVELYFQRYQCLAGDNTIKLLLADAERFFSENPKGNSLSLERVDQFSNAVLQIDSKNKNKELQNSFLLSAQNKDSGVIISLRALPYFFPAKSLKGKQKATDLKRSTKAMAAAFFIPLFSTVEEANDFFSENSLPTPRLHIIGNYEDLNNQYSYLKT